MTSAPRLQFLITAGPTREAIDPVRFLSNRSSGRMGFAIAHAAAEAGHRVTLVSGPVSLQTPVGVERRNVVSADDMFHAVAERSADADIAVFSAAVADYKPVQVAAQKIKKGEGALSLAFERTRDILGSMRREMKFAGVLVGFAAETENLEANARAKLKSKSCDLIVANDVSRSSVGFDAHDNEVVLLFRRGKARWLPRMSKLEIARELVRVCEALHCERQQGH
ncbi:MAG: phosphopantothenoylcysteine decarboxylase [Verrucomicrobiales bacterium]